MNKSIVKLIIIVMLFLYGTATIIWLIVPSTTKMAEKVIVQQVEQKIKQNIPAVKEKITESFRKPILELVDPPQKKINSWAYYLKNIDVDKAIRANADMIIIDRETKNGTITKQHVQKLKDSGKLVIAYLSLGEAEDYRSYWKDDWEPNDPNWLGEQSKVWKGNYFVKDLLSQQWTNITNDQITQVKQLGFDGILIAGITQNQNADKFIERVSIFSKRDNSKFKVLIQNYNSKEIVNIVDGIVREGLSYNILGVVNKNTSTEIEKLKQFKQPNKDVFVVEFVTDAKKDVAKKVLDDNGFIGFFGPLELNDIK